MCRSYGTIKIDSNLQGNPSLPLAQRAPCSACHANLEPFARGFSGWLPEDSNNYYLAANKKTNGAFGNKPYADFADLAKVMVEDPDYARCAVLSSFEFAMNRSMSEAEEDTLLPPLVEVYKNSDSKIWPVIKEIIKSDKFVKAFKLGE